MAVVRLIDFIQYSSPFLMLWVITPVLVLVTWRLTIGHNDKRIMRWVESYGDQKLVRELGLLRRELKQKDEMIEKLERRVKSLLGTVRAALQTNAQTAQILRGQGGEE